MNDGRIVFIDYCKAIAIACVVWGHIIYVYDTDCDNNPIKLFIYSFHCPLFMFLSGIFLSRNFNKGFKDILFGKATSLLLPYFVWSLLCLFYITIPIKYNGVFISGIKVFVMGGAFHYYWYTKLLFIYLLLTVTVIKVMNNQYLGCLASFLFFSLLPDFSFSSIMIPFFIIGHLSWPLVSKMNKWYHLVICALICILLFMLWTPDCNYDSKAPLAFRIYTIRTGIGIFVSLFTILLFKKIWVYIPFVINRGVSMVGIRTLGIYFSAEIFYRGYAYFVLRGLNINNNNKYLIVAISVLLLSTVLVMLLEKNEITSLLFLGKYTKNKRKKMSVSKN